MHTVPRPLIGNLPRAVEAERVFCARPQELYDAWTIEIERWFAQEGTLAMLPQVGSAWFFYNRNEWGRHPHYGRFLALETGRLIETTWLTGNGAREGTWGAETTLRIELAIHGDGTRLTLVHTGFVSDESRDGHAENWPLALDALAAALGES